MNTKIIAAFKKAQPLPVLPEVRAGRLPGTPLGLGEFTKALPEIQPWLPILRSATESLDTRNDRMRP